jgi:hypothetical protein
MKIIREVLKGIAAAPGKSLLTIFSVGAGVGVLIAFAAAVLIRGTFGIFPLFSALQTPIAEGIREV